MRTLIIVALALGLCVPAAAQVDLLHGSDSLTESGLAVYSSDAGGDQSWVREYDGRDFDHGAFEYFNSFGYSGETQYALRTTDVFFSPWDMDFNVMSANRVGFTFFTNGLLHRLPAFPASDPALVGTAAAGGDNKLDFSPGQKFSFSRRVNDAAARIMLDGDATSRLIIGSWNEEEEGFYQQQFRARQAKAGVIANRQKGLVGLPLHRVTEQNRYGIDMPLGNIGALNYRRQITDFTDRSTLPAPGSRLDFLPLNSLTRTGSHTAGNIFKARLRLGNRLHLTGVRTNKSRDNNRTTMSSPTSISKESTNAALTYLVNDAWTVTGRYRSYELDNFSLLSPSGALPETRLTTSNRSTELEASYAGFARTFLRFGYERLEMRRTIPAGEHDVEEDEGEANLHHSNDANIWRASLRLYPTSKMSMDANYENYDANVPGYTGEANKRERLNVNTTYMITPSAAFYANYARWNDKNTNVPVPLASIPTPTTDAAGQALREDAAGEFYKNKTNNIVLGAWYSLNSRLNLDVNYANMDVDSNTLLLFGDDPAFTPHLVPEVGGFKAENDQWSAGATYVLNSATRFRGRFGWGNSFGRMQINPALYPGNLGPTWNPYKSDETQYMLGVSRDMGLNDSLDLDFTRLDWTDKINSAWSGNYSLWRLAWNHKY